MFHVLSVISSLLSSHITASLSSVRLMVDDACTPPEVKAATIQPACKEWDNVNVCKVSSETGEKNVWTLGPRNDALMRQSCLCSPDAGAHFCYVTVVMTDETQQSHD